MSNPTTASREPRYERVPLTTRESCRVQAIDVPALPLVWHYHPECELILVTAGRGRRFVGESVEVYAPPDLVLLGPNLPHTWASDGSLDAGPQRAIVVQFAPDFLGAHFLERPEVAHVAALLRRSAPGLRFPVRRSDRLVARVRRLQSRTGLPRLLALLEVLDELAGRDDAVVLSRGWNAPGSGGRRLEDALRLLHERYTDDVRLSDAARAASLSPAAFSRFFHASTGRTFTDYLIDLRVSAARRLLVATDLPIAVVAAHTGFRSLANFNRRFRERSGCTPSAYRDAAP